MHEKLEKEKITLKGIFLSCFELGRMFEIK